MMKKILNPLRRHKLAWLLAAGLALLVIAAVGVWWMLPYYHARRTMPAYLEKNQRYFRAGRILPGTFNYLALQEISLGDSTRPLLTATTGRIYLSYAGGRRGATPVFRQLVLDDAGLTMKVKGRSIRLNGIPLAEFVTQLTALPAAPDGTMIPLLVKGDFRLAGARGTPICFSVTPGSQPDEFIFAGEWYGDRAAADSDEIGRWKAIYDRTSGNLAVTLDGAVAVPFWQEILLRAHEPELVATVIRTGHLEGKGTFAARLPDLPVSDFTFAGTLSDGAFSFQNLDLRAAKPFAFELLKSGQRCRWSVPKLELDGDFPVPLSNVVIERQVKRAEVEFSADADLRGAWVRMLQSYCGLNAVSNTPVMRRVTGRINAQTAAWSLEGRASEEAGTPRDLLFEDKDRHATLSAMLDALSLQGHGTGASGMMESTLGVHALTLNLPQGAFKADRLDLHSVRQLGNAGQNDDRIEFHSGKVSGDTADGQCEITNLSGDVGIHRPAPDKTELQWVANGNLFRLFAKTGEIRAQNCLLAATASHDRQTDLWNAALNVQCGKTESRFRSASGTFSDLKLNLAGAWQQGLTTAAARLRAGLFSGKCGKAKALDAKWNYEAKSRQWSGELNAAALEIPVGAERPWHAVNCALSAAGNGWQLPESFSVKADELNAAYAGWRLDFRGGEWKIARQGNDVFCQSSMADLHAVSPNRRAGDGDSGVGRFDLTLRLAPEGGVAEWMADLTCERPSWSWQELHAGGEKGQLALHYRSGDNVPYSASVQLQKATLLNTYFSAMAPEFAVRGEYSPASGAKGNLNFASGAITAPDGRLELADASVNLPWNVVPGGAACETAAGTLTATKVLFDGENQGALAVNLAHLNSALIFDGAMETLRFGNVPLALNGKLQLPPAEPKLALTLDLPKSELTAPWNLGRWIPALEGAAALKGRFAIHVALEHAKEKLAGTAAFAAEDSDWQFGNASLEGVTAQAEFSDLTALVTRAAFPVSVRRFAWRDFELTDNRATLALLPDNKLVLNAWRGQYAQGMVELTAPAEGGYLKAPNAENTSAFALNFNAEKIPLADFLHKLGLRAVESDAAVSGRIAARYQAGRLHFGPSRIGFRATAGEILKMNEVEHSIIRMKDPVYQSFVQSVLREVRCTEGDFDFQEEGHELVMKIKADGYPVRPVPFVYQGRKAASLFRAAEPGEAGFDGEIQFSVKLKMLAPAYRAQ